MPGSGNDGVEGSRDEGARGKEKEAGAGGLWYLLILAGVLYAGLALPAGWARAEVQALPDWLEPRGLSIAELVGEVPEEHLQGMIISYGTHSGIVVYESGTRVQDEVVLTATLYSRLYHRSSAPNNLVTEFGCLGQTPYFDHMGSVVPTSTLRIYDGAGMEVTAQIERMYISRMDAQKPFDDSRAVVRYPEERYGSGSPDPLPLGPNGLTIPPNSGCRIELPGADIYPLTGVFRLEFPAAVRASVLATQHASFKTAIFPGNWGLFTPLMSQLVARYPNRHGRIGLNVPAGADFVLVKFPPTGGDGFADSFIDPPHYNVGRPAAGTYRLGRQTVNLGQNLIFSAAFPLAVTWRDADQAPGSEYLPLIVAPNQLAPPEYILPTGIPYNPCFVAGTCSTAVLEQIHNAVMDMEILYLSVTAVEPAGQWVHARFAGPQWPGVALGNVSDARAQPELVAVAPSASPQAWRLYLPIVWRQFTPPEPPAGIPAGWFDELGRMLDFSPG